MSYWILHIEVNHGLHICIIVFPFFGRRSIGTPVAHGGSVKVLRAENAFNWEEGALRWISEFLRSMLLCKAQCVHGWDLASTYVLHLL